MHGQGFLTRQQQWLRWKHAGTALMIAAFVSLICIFGTKFTTNVPSLSFIHRFFILLGGKFSAGGYIQFFTFFAFFWALLEARHYKHEFDMSRVQALVKGIAGQKSPSNLDINSLEHIVLNFEKSQGKFVLSDLLKKVVQKLKLNPSISETLDLVNVQIDIYREKAFGAQNLIRYLNFAIPSLGFIGTVLGLSDAMMIAHTGDMEKISLSLGVAFDTTPVALVLGLILMWDIHELEELTDLYHAETKDFIYNNLVPKIESKGQINHAQKA